MLATNKQATPATRRRLVPRLPVAAQTTRARPSIHPLELIPLALLVGLLTGPAELIALFLRRHLLDPSAISAVELNRHAIWMLPLSTGLLSLMLGLILAPVAHRIRHPKFTGLALCGILFLAVYDLMLLYRGLTSLACAVLSAGIAFNLAPPLLKVVATRRRWVYTGLGAFVALLTTAVAVDYLRDELAEVSTVEAHPGYPNVLFIVLDTVRAQSMSLYGNPRPTTPNLARFAARGLRFDNARVAAPWTLPSHASMFTGHWPSELSARLDNPLDGTFPTLAEYLRDNGYATAGFVANTFFCSRWYGLNRGFLHYEDVAWAPREIISSSYVGRAITRKFFPSLHDRPTAYFDRKDAPTINSEFQSWLASRQKGHPFFAFLNYYDAHDPYVTPTSAMSSDPEPESGEFETIRDWHHMKKSHLPQETIVHARDAYEGCVTYLDDQIGRLLKALQDDGTLDNTLVVITADHGEEFKEHGDFGHGNNLYNPAVRVPLVILPPSRDARARVITEPVSLRDLPATIVDLLGLSNRSPFPGHSLTRFDSHAAGPGAIDTDRVVLSEIVDNNGLESTEPRLPRALASGKHVYIRDRDSTEKLFDIAADPSQTQNLMAAPNLAPVLESFRETMRKLDAQFPLANRAPSPSSIAFR